MISKTATKEIKLIPFTKENVKKTFGWVRDSEIQRLFLIRGEITWKGHLEYFEKSLNDPSQRIYAIICDGLHVGNCGIKHLSKQKKEGEIWIYIGEPSLRNKRIGRRATRDLLRNAFDMFCLKKVYLHLTGFNTVAHRLYKKFGFHEVPIPDESGEWKNRSCKIIRLELNKKS